MWLEDISRLNNIPLVVESVKFLFCNNSLFYCQPCYAITPDEASSLCTTKYSKSCEPTHIEVEI